MAQQRRGGIIQVQINGEVIEVVGSWSHDLGGPVREAQVGSDGVVHGFKETTAVGFIEGEIRDSRTLNVAALRRITGATVTMDLPNGKTFVLRDAFAAGPWQGSTEEGVLAARFEGSGEEIP